MQHNGFEYQCEDDSDGDRRRCNHLAVNLETGEVTYIDQTGYSGMTEEAFKAHVELGFPSRPEPCIVPWTNETITREYWKDHD